MLNTNIFCDCRVDGEQEFQQFNAVLSILSYLCKAPLVPGGTPVVNALFRQKMCIENIFRWVSYEANQTKVYKERTVQIDVNVNVSCAMWNDQYFDWVYFSKLAISHNVISRP